VTQVEPFDVNTPYPTEFWGTAMTIVHRLDAIVLLGDHESNPGDIRAGRILRDRAAGRPPLLE
jgi:hypothetical protein